MESLKKAGCCGTYPILFLRSLSEMCLIFFLLKKICPLVGSRRPKISLAIVDFPDPVLPIIPIIPLPFTLKETSCTIFLSLISNQTFLNSKNISLCFNYIYGVLFFVLIAGTPFTKEIIDSRCTIPLFMSFIAIPNNPKGPTS